MFHVGRRGRDVAAVTTVLGYGAAFSSDDEERTFRAHAVWPIWICVLKSRCAPEAINKEGEVTARLGFLVTIVNDGISVGNTLQHHAMGDGTGAGPQVLG